MLSFMHALDHRAAGNEGVSDFNSCLVQFSLKQKRAMLQKEIESNPEMWSLGVAGIYLGIMYRECKVQYP